MADTSLEKNAKDLGLEVEHATTAGNGYIRISGKTSEVLRAWAMAGYDRKQTLNKEHIKSWNFYQNGEYAGCCDSLPVEDFGYSFTSCI